MIDMGPGGFVFREKHLSYNHIFPEEGKAAPEEAERNRKYIGGTEEQTLFWPAGPNEGFIESHFGLNLGIRNFPHRYPQISFKDISAISKVLIIMAG